MYKFFHPWTPSFLRPGKNIKKSHKSSPFQRFTLCSFHKPVAGGEKGGDQQTKLRKMTQRWLICAFLGLIVQQISAQKVDPDLYRNVTQMITARGYPCEDYSVTTEDGFILG
jgi:hypothetical protein